MFNAIDLIARVGVLPVISIERTEDAAPLADALLEGGLPIAEITFRTKAAADIIATIHQIRPEFCVGAGTLLTAVDLQRACNSGASFGLAPGFDPTLVDDAASRAWPFFPGVMTPTDLSNAVRRDVRIVKFFPAQATGGFKMLRAIAAPFNHVGVGFIPTGGVTESSIGDWLSIKEVVAVGGTWIAKPDDIRQGRFSQIARNAAGAVETARKALERRQR